MWSVFRALMGLRALSETAMPPSMTPITSLPGAPDFSSLGFGLHSGYVNVSRGRHVFYVLVESAGEPSSDPLTVWFQGGPGCSGLLGFLTEHGPFNVQSDGSLVRNPFAWNRRSNMLYLEQPVGVGFSYQEGSPALYKSGDESAATDNAAFLRGWLAQHPAFAGRDLWLAGESYGGLYVPTLAQAVLAAADGTATNSSAALLAGQLRGFMLGNPVLLCHNASLYDDSSMTLELDRLFYSGMASYSSWRGWHDAGCERIATLPWQGRRACYVIYDRAQRGPSSRI